MTGRRRRRRDTRRRARVATSPPTWMRRRSLVMTTMKKVRTGGPGLRTPTSPEDHPLQQQQKVAPKLPDWEVMMVMMVMRER